MAALEELSFKEVDELGYAAQMQLLERIGAPRMQVKAIGPLFELIFLCSSGTLPYSKVQQNRWIDAGRFTALERALSGESNLWLCPRTKAAAFMRTSAEYTEAEELRWTDFVIKARGAAQHSGRPAHLADLMLGAIKELHSNIYEHSGHSKSGVVAFAAHEKTLEFVVADQGDGVLKSLSSNPDHASLRSHGEALRLALQPGVTRHKYEAGRGHGFDRLYNGLANINTSIRLRSGDHALILDGVSSTTQATWRPAIKQKPFIQGLFIYLQWNIF